MAEEGHFVYLGIDIGTTSVKVVVVDETGNVLCSSSQPSTANVESDIGSLGDEQNPAQILKTVQDVVEPLIEPYLNKIKAIGVTGQMHGVLFWSKEAATPDSSGDATLTSLDKGCQTSPLYTWQDQRCSAQFLASLPTQSNPYMPPSTGHGLATLYWFVKNRPEYLKKFTHCATIMDYLTYCLCGLDQPVTSCQLGTSMGYFNLEKCAWDSVLYDSEDFPSDLLPSTVSVGQLIGKTCQGLRGWPAKVPVYVGMGDLQCAMYTVLKNRHDAAINISTSIQLAFAIPSKDIVTVRSQSPPSIAFYPYFEQQHLAVCAGLNGGNVIQCFVESLVNWMRQLGITHDVSASSLFKKLQVLAENSQDGAGNNCPITFNPSFFGERHDTSLTGTISGITSTNLGDLGSVFHALSRGVLDHLHSMVPNTYLTQQGINRLLVSGSVPGNNSIVRNRLIELYNRDSLNVLMDTTGQEAAGSAVGAAMVLQMFTN